MIHFNPPPEPPDFDARVRQPGRRWLANPNHHAKRPRDFWSAFKSQLARGFNNLCAYSAMYEPVGTVDHYLSVDNHRNLAYEWSNYRYAAQWINSSKGNADERVLDPFQVQDGWFEILLPSFQLVLTDRVPAKERDRAAYTLRRLRLQNGEAVMRQRQEWYETYQRGGITLDELERKAPLIARAIRRQQRQVNTP